MPKIVVTGAAGFIGLHLSEALLCTGCDVVALDNFDDFYDPDVKWRNIETALKHPRFSLVEGDIRDRETVERALADDTDTVVHLAARAGVRPSIEQPFLYQEVNVGGTTVLLEAARKLPHCKFIFASSSSVYGNNPKVPFAESDSVDAPISPYAATKLAGELLCRTYHHLYNMPVTCLRFFTVFGPRQRPDLAIHKFARLIEAGQPIPVFGDGRMMRDFTYVDDIVSGVLQAIRRCSGFRIYNLGQSKPVKLSDLITAIEDALGQKAVIDRQPLQPGDVVRTFADVSLARDELDYEPSTSLTVGLQHFVKWFRSDANRPFDKRAQRRVSQSVISSITPSSPEPRAFPEPRASARADARPTTDPPPATESAESQLRPRSASTPMINALTVDVEDWVQSVLDHHLPLTERFVANTDRILELLAAHDVRATFFVLGLAAQKSPELVRRIHRAGHEVQSHGFGHRPVHTQTRAQFRDDVLRSKTLLEDIIGQCVTGYRAPAFSITRRNLWALDTLAECGFTYDSSIFPLGLRRYGIRGAPTWPHRLRTPNGRELIEIPVATWRVLGRRLPLGGGGYFRLFPYAAIRSAVRQLNRHENPATIYFHPYELNATELSELPNDIPIKLRLHQGMGRRGFSGKIDCLLSDFQFGTIQEMLRASAELPRFEYTEAPDQRPMPAPAV